MAITKMTTNNMTVRMQRKGNTLAQLVGFPGGSMVKNLPGNAGNARKDPWVRKIPWRRKWQPTPVFLPGKSHRQRSLAGYSSQGCQESDITERTRTHTGMAVAMENSMVVPSKIKNRTAVQGRNSTLGEYPILGYLSENKNTNSKRHMQPYVHCIIIYNSQEMEAT